MSDWCSSSVDAIVSVLRRGSAPVYVSSSPVLAIGQRCVRNEGFDISPARPHMEFVPVAVEPVAGDVLLNSTGTGTIGRSCVFPRTSGRFMVDGHVTVLRGKPEFVDGRILNELLRSPVGQRLLETRCFTGSTNQVELSRSELARTEFALPPLGEQLRIAEILDTIDEAIRATERVVAKLLATHEGLVRSILADCDRGWRVPLRDVAEVSGGLSISASRPVSDPVEVPYLRVANVQDGFIDTSIMRVVRVSKAEVGRYSVAAGDVLMNEGGDFDKLGRGAVWDGRISPCLHQNHVFRVRCKPSTLVPEFLALFCRSSEGKSYFVNSSKQTTNLASINKMQIESLPTLVPSMLVQSAVVETQRASQSRIDAEKVELMKTREIRDALAADLLSGRVRTVTS